MNVFWIVTIISILWIALRCALLVMRPAGWVPPSWWLAPCIIGGTSLILGVLT